MAYRVGLTGGIGSGKTTVCAVLAEMGATVVDADAISRATTANGGSAIALLRSAFGSDVLCADGSLDREKMRGLIYSNPDARTRLEAIIHPLVASAVAEQAQQAERSGAKCIVFDIPLLVESGHWRARLDRILVIDCTEHTQVTRVVTRNGLTPVEAQRILAAQASRPHRLAAADLVVFNDGIAVSELRQQVQELGSQFGL